MKNERNCLACKELNTLLHNPRGSLGLEEYFNCRSFLRIVDPISAFTKASHPDGLNISIIFLCGSTVQHDIPLQNNERR